MKACVYDEVSLTEFEELREDELIVFSLDCRCGGQFTISQEDLEAGFDLVSCSNCTARTLITK
jgi:diphthamide biosynthesis protein 4